MRDTTLIQALNDLEKKGIVGRQAFPLPYKFLWDIGLTVRPPLFATSLQLFLVNSTFFAIAWGGLMILRFFLPKQIPIETGNLIFLTLAGGLAFGLVMTFIIRQRAKKLNLPKWESYH